MSTRHYESGVCQRSDEYTCLMRASPETTGIPRVESCPICYGGYVYECYIQYTCT